MRLDDLKIIVPIRNEAHNIAHFIQSIPQEVKLIIIDSGEDESSEIACRLRSGSTLVYKSELRIAPARHFGAEMASTSWLLFTDADIQFSENYFTILQDLPVYDAFYGPKLSHNEFKSYYASIAFWQGVAYFFHIPAVSGSNFIVRRSAYNASGGFDSELLVNEDSELGWRLPRHGYRVKFISQLIVYAWDHRRLRRGVVRKTFHSILRCTLLYLNLMPRRWRVSYWGYWKPVFK